MKKISMADVVALPVAERLRLVEAIWESISQFPDQVPLTPEQCAELDRRLLAYEQDRDAGDSWAAVRGRLERTM